MKHSRSNRVGGPAAKLVLRSIRHDEVKRGTFAPLKAVRLDHEAEIEDRVAGSHEFHLGGSSPSASPLAGVGVGRTVVDQFAAVQFAVRARDVHDSVQREVVTNALRGAQDLKFDFG